MARVSIKDIAQALGISSAAVSYALNDAPGVSEDIRRMVKETASKMNYQPHFSAKSLAANKTYTIAWVTVAHPTLVDPFSAMTLSSAALAFQEQGYSMLLHNLKPHDLPSLKNLFLQKRIDGAVLSNCDLPGDLLTPFQKEHLPVLLTEPSQNPLGIPAIWPEYRKGILTLFHYLVQKGYRKIGFIPADLQEITARERLAGYQQGHELHGLTVNPAWIAGTGYSAQEARSAAFQLLTQPDRPDAIMATTDRMAVAVIQVAQELGLDVPGDVAVTGFDDSEFATYVRPPLTTVRLSPLEFGQSVARSMVELLAGKLNTGVEISVPVQLVVRQSA